MVRKIHIIYFKRINLLKRLKNVKTLIMMNLFNNVIGLVNMNNK